MLRMRATIVTLLCLVLALSAVVALAGCTSATTTTVSGETTTSGGGEATTTTASGTTGTSTETTGTGTTPTTSAETTGGAESVAPVSDNFKICTSCHGDFNQFLAASKVLTKNFSHAVHLNKGITCEQCHVVPTHQPDKIARPSMLACFKCHSQEPGAQAPGECGVCHPKDFPLVPASHNQPGWMPVVNQGVPTVTSKHGPTATQDPAYCNMCHAQKFCLDCHKTPMPHGADWQQNHPVQVKKSGSASCAQCHPDKLICEQCHHTGYKQGSSWIQQHPPIVQANGAEGCFKCHNPLTCAHCHVRGEFKEFQK